MLRNVSSFVRFSFSKIEKDIASANENVELSKETSILSLSSKRLESVTQIFKRRGSDRSLSLNKI